MKTNGKIILVDDNELEKILLQRSIDQLELNNELMYFSNAEDAFEYLKKHAPNIFLIISDMNMPGWSGLDLKKNLDAIPKLRKESIPFIFYSNSSRAEEICAAYEYRIQGYFSKETKIEEMTAKLRAIVEYWQMCLKPENC